MSESATLQEIEKRVTDGDLHSAESLAGKLADGLALTRAYGLLASAYQRRGDANKADDCWVRAFRGSSGVPLQESSLLRLALSGDIERLLAELDEIYKPKPPSEMDFASMVASAMAAMFDSDPATARRIGGSVERARAAMLAGDRTAALEAMAFVGDRSIEKARMLRGLATLCALQGLTEQAQRLLDAAASRTPGKLDQGPLHALCHAFVEKGDLDAAMATLARIEKHDKYSFETRCTVVLALFRARRFDVMLRACDGFKPGRQTDAALLRLVEDLCAGGVPRIAEDLCDRIVGVPARSKAMLFTARCYERMGLADEAARLSAETPARRSSTAIQ
jgi:tetratricopeptide (TPR) repeat protein